MNLRKKIGQLLVVGFAGKVINEEIKTLIHQFHIGSVILFSRNLGTPQQVLKLTNDLQAEAKKAGYKYPLLITIDQENGIVRRLTEGVTTVPGAMLLGATQNPYSAFKAGYVTGKELKALGINWNLAPVADVNNNAKNPVIGVRSFGGKVDDVAAFVKQSMHGMQKAKVITTLKHFPGHGDTSVDSHLDLPVIHHDLQRLHAIELVPFKQCIAAGADVIMSAHVYFPALEPASKVPATLSKRVMTDLLREQLNFNGVITTDCMEMDAIANSIGTVEGCVRAIEAGVDFVMISHTFELQKQVIFAIEEAIQQGRLTEQRIDESIARIERMLEKYISWDDVAFDDKVPAYVGGQQHALEMKKLYSAGITIVKSGKPFDRSVRTLVISPIIDAITGVEDHGTQQIQIASLLTTFGLHASEATYKLNDTLQHIDHLVAMAMGYEQVVVVTINTARYDEQSILLEKLQQLGKQLHVVAARSPYDALNVKQAETVICSYELTAPVIEALALYFMRGHALQGRLPITQGETNI